MLLNWLLLAIPFALAWTFGKMAKDRKQGYAVLGAMVGLFAIGALLVMPLEAAGNVHVTQAHVTQAITSTSPGGNMEGKEVRYGPIVIALFNSLVHQHLDRIDQLGQRQLHPARGRRAPVQHDARRGEPGRHRLRALRHAHHGHPGGVHRRTDGRADAGIPRQEDPGEGDEAGRPLPADGAVRDPAVHGDLGGDALVTDVDLQPGAARAHRGHVRLHLGVEQQRLGVRRSRRQHQLVQHDARHLHAGRPVRPDGARSWPSPARWVASSAIPASAGTLPTGTPLFALLMAGIAVIVVGLTYFPVLALGPIVEHLVGKF